MNSRRQKKVDPALSVDLLEDRCLPSGLASLPGVADQALKHTESVAVLIADVHPGASSAEAHAEHRQDTTLSHHDKAVHSVEVDAGHRSDDRIPAQVSIDVTTIVVSEPVSVAIASRGNVGASEAASLEVAAAPVAVATVKTAIGVAASTSAPGSTPAARPVATPAATPVSGAAGKAAAAPAVQVAAPGANPGDSPAAAVGMVPGVPANLLRPEIPGTSPGSVALPSATVSDGPAAGNPAPGAAVALVANPVADEDPALTGVSAQDPPVAGISAAPAPDGFFSPLGGELVADLPIRMPDFAAVEKAFDQLADWVGLDAVRGGGSWLLAAAMAALAAEVARRQMTPTPASGVPPDDGPPSGWLPEGDAPMPGDDGHA